jgi:hypothetical protein
MPSFALQMKRVSTDEKWFWFFQEGFVVPQEGLEPPHPCTFNDC